MRNPTNFGRPEGTVSIILLNYNGREHLDACLSSLLDVDFPSEQFEIIVVDNGSSDESVDLIKSRWPGAVLIENQVNLGFSRAANLGAANAAGEYLAFLNNDMRVDKSWLSALVDTARSGTGFSCVGSTVLNWDGTAVDFNGRPGDAFSLSYSASDSPTIVSSTAEPYSRTLFVSGGAAIITREVFRELGGFDPDFFLYHEDVDLGWRLWLRGHQCVLSTESVVYHKGGASSAKLPWEYIQYLSQRNALFTVFKNLEANNLREFLPRLLYFFLERGRWVPAASQSLGSAMTGFQSSLMPLINRRNEVQRTRIRTDLDVFEELGHPLNFLLGDSTNDLIQKKLVEVCSDFDFEPNDPESVRRAITEWLNQAHLLFESQLIAELEHTIDPNTRAASAGWIEHGSGLDTRDRMTAFLEGTASDYRERIEHLTASIEALNEEKLQNERGRQVLSYQLARTEGELKKIKDSVGWRLLSRYGRFKYRYLLPVYRLFDSKIARPETPQTEPRVNNPQVLKTSDRYDIVCLPIIDWNFRFQRPQQLSSLFALDGHRVFYIRTKFNPSSPTALAQEIDKNIYDVQLPGPAHLNLYREEIDKQVLDSLVGSLERFREELFLEDAICLVQLPFWGPLALELKRRWGWKVVYDCMDEHGGFSTTNATMIKHEAALIADSDLVLATSRTLYNKAIDSAKRAVLLPNAADFQYFNSQTSVSPLSNLPRPIIGYYGAISEWFDLDMIYNAAVARPDWQFVLIGDTFGADVSSLKRLKNLHLLGEQPYTSLPGYLHQFDVACIPFLRNPLTEATNPVKFYEYLSAGKPVVATDLPDLEPHRELFYQVQNREDFVHQVEAALKEDSPAKQHARIEFARANTWQRRHEVLESSIKQLYSKTAIIIVSFKNLEYLRLCLESIWTRTLYPNFEVVVVDNGAQPDIVEYLQSIAKREPRLKVILNGENLGFARANNIGIRAAEDSDFVVLLNDDTVVTRGWLGKLIRHLENNNIGLIGPVTNWAGNEARIDVTYQTIEEMDEFARRYMREQSGKSFDIPMLAMYCVAMRKSLLDEIGLLDERFGIGMFEDDDFSFRVRRAGYRIVCAEDIFIHHWGKASFAKLRSSAYDRLFAANRRKFEEKWGEEWTPHKARFL